MRKKGPPPPPPPFVKGEDRAPVCPFAQPARNPEAISGPRFLPGEVLITAHPTEGHDGGIGSRGKADQVGLLRPEELIFLPFTSGTGCKALNKNTKKRPLRPILASGMWTLKHSYAAPMEG